MSIVGGKLVNHLNRDQVAAVVHTEGPLMVLAGAGTGKTRVITYRAAYMIEQGIPPEQILGLTFTNKAAREMKQRIYTLVPRGKAEGLFLGTFHAFCASVLRRDIVLLGYGRNFSIADEVDQTGLLKQAMAECNISKDVVSPSLCLSLIGIAKGEKKHPSEVNIYDPALKVVFPELYKRYQQMLKNQNMLDFDDLLLLTVHLFEEHPGKLEACQERYRYIMVDEYQDTNYLQFLLLSYLAGSRRNICVVGDDDQSIYGWRGAKIDNILNFPDHFKGAKSLKLEQNYRSTTNILDASNSLISCNKGRHGKSLWSECDEGDKIRVVKSESDFEEASYVGDAIYDIQYTTSACFRDFAVLYRSNYQSRMFEESFRNARIPYVIVGGKSFYDRKEVRDAVAYLRLIVNEKDDQSLLRILSAPPRGLGDKAIDTLRRLQSITFAPMLDLMSSGDYLEQVSSKGAESSRKLIGCIRRWREVLTTGVDLGVNVMNYLREVEYLDGLQRMYKDREESEKRRENVLELVNAAHYYARREGASATLAGFLENYSLADDSDKVDDVAGSEDSVMLMTVHAAKGLEFKNVFIVGVEEKIFPNERALDAGSAEEERRLFYVGMTRAQKLLTLTWAKKRMRHGQLSQQTMSRFLREIPKDLVEGTESSKAFKKASYEAMERAFQNFNTN
ncbi:MAG: UvrD-helicase domain-containing protein [Victivallales bacterium]|nr:UvrD-helicase domain-containing protein [Victivallales bacterium]